MRRTQQRATRIDHVILHAVDHLIENALICKDAPLSLSNQLVDLKRGIRTQPTSAGNWQRPSWLASS
tara:strand:- start:2551 stop:2751 length:201 start_codon:yes stop_codon:yes gene_type:complete